MSTFWVITIKLAIPVLCVLFVLIMLLANGRVAIPRQTRTIESLHIIENDSGNTAFLLSYLDKVYLKKQNAEMLHNYLSAFQLRPKLWRTDMRLSGAKAKIFLHDSTGIIAEISIIDEYTIEINSHVYKVMNGVDFEYIISCFTDAEDLSYLLNVTPTE